MARISTYAIDGTPVSSDKLIGTDDSGVATKNYPLGTVAAWLKESGATAILGQNNFIFQTEVDPQVGRLPGTFSLPVVGGDGTPFSDITTLKFSITSSAGQYVVDYIASTVGSKVILGQLDDLNAFGVYALESFTQDPETPTFYNAVLSLASGNGSLISAKSYGFATYSSSATSGGTWGGITGTITNQTDLVDYIDAEIAAIPTPATPTLQSVTDAGAITTNDITTGSVTSNGNFLITGNDSTVQLRGSSVDFNIQTTAADNVARIATTTGGSARLDLYNHISGFNGALEFRATSWENDALVISGGTPNATKFLVSRDPNAATLQVTGESYFTGNVGIGTTAPTASMHVYSTTGILSESPSNASIKIKRNDNPGYSALLNYFTGNSIKWVAGLSDSGDFTGSTGNEYFIGPIKTTPYLLIDSGGNVAIGKETANFLLDVGDGVNNTFITKINPNGNIYIGSSDNTRFGFAGGQVNLGFATGGDNNNVPLALGTFSNAQPLILGTDNLERVRIDGPTGNVGIGTTAPAAKLHVEGTSMFVGQGTWPMTMENNVASGNAEMGLWTVTDAYAQSEAFSLVATPQPNVSSRPIWYFQAAGNGWRDMTLQRYGGRVGIRTLEPSANLTVQGSGTTTDKTFSAQDSNASELFTILDNGNVGIGTTAPTQKLDVSGTIKVNTWGHQIALYGGDGSTLVGRLSYTGTTLRIQGNDGIRFEDTNGSNIHGVITDAGNFGIGTTAPSSTLHVAGTIQQTVDAAANQYPIQLYNDHAGTDYYLLRQRVVDTGSKVRTGLGITGVPDAAFVLGSQTDQIIKFESFGSIVNVATISATSTMKINATEIRTGNTSQSSGAHFNVTGTNSSSNAVLGLQQGASASNLMIDIRNSNGTSTMGLTSEGGFYFRDTNVIGRYTFDHDYLPSTVDGLTTGFEFRTENASGVLTPFGYIDVTNDDKTLQQSSMRFSVGQSTPAEIMRLQSDGNVGIGTTAPAHVLHINKDNPYIQIQDSSAPTRGDMSAGIIMKDSTGAQSFQITQSNSVDVSIRANAGDLSLGTFVGTVIKLDGSNVGVGTTAPNSKVHISGTAMQQLRMETAGGPSSSGDTSGRIGDMAYDDDFFYIKTANGWGRVQLDFGF